MQQFSWTRFALPVDKEFWKHGLTTLSWVSFHIFFSLKSIQFVFMTSDLHELSMNTVHRMSIIAFIFLIMANFNYRVRCGDSGFQFCE